MKLFAHCKSCKEDFKLGKSYSDRPELIHHLGEYFRLSCAKCGTSQEYHANDIVAKDLLSGRLIGTAIGLLILVITTIFIWNQGFITNLGLVLGGGVIAASNMSALTSNTKAFNSYKVTRNPKNN